MKKVTTKNTSFKTKSLNREALESFNKHKKKMVSMRLDTDIVEYFKSFGEGYQTKINYVLRNFVDRN